MLQFITSNQNFYYINVIQHVASRVEDLPVVVARANRLRRATGEGLAFLGVPRSYYGL